MTDIEWVKNADGSQGRTWNPIRGCTRVSPGCGGPGPHGGCYAEVIAARFSGPGLPYEGIAEMRGGKPRWTGKLAFVDAKLTEPLKVRKPTTWFVNSMSDLFHEAVSDAWIDRVFAVMALCPQHTFQVLTKRSARMRAYMADPIRESRVGAAVMEAAPVGRDIRPATLSWTPRKGRGSFDFNGRWPLPNVWLGVSTEDQRRADERVPDLLATPAAVRFVSAEPLLGPIDFTNLDNTGTCRAEKRHGISALWKTTLRPHLDWIIVGKESGRNARWIDDAPVRAIRDQCISAGVAFFYKQDAKNGKKIPTPELDGVRWAQMPGAAGQGRPHAPSLPDGEGRT